MKLTIAILFCVFTRIAFAAPVSFESEVMPLLEKRCNKCHYPEEQRGGLDLTRIATMLRGGDDLGPAIAPSKPDDSPLIQVLTGAKKPEMPKKGEKLPASEIELLRRWIAEGARDDSPTFASDDVAFFEREIRPVLASRCFKCHAGDEPEHGLRLTSRQGIISGGQRGPAAVVGKPEASLILKAIRHEGELKMPRRGDKLSDAQIAAFEQWIAKGLPWPVQEKLLARAKQFTISDADRNHWAFRPLPKAVPADWSIDAVLKPHHEKLGLTPAPEADCHRLLRRITYDLIGYPPTPEEIAAFVNDVSPDAFEKVVTRLLDSPQFGQRWGRHWLDYTRNGANAQSNRGPALDSQRYAEWVARCFNEDRPWDWFARVHLAGDKMKAFEGDDYSVDQALAAAVPLNGQRTFESIGIQTFTLMDKLDEGVEFMGRSLMGISLECARCHDHKFDPISQRDYYALLGFFQSSWFGPVPVNTKSRAEADAAVSKHRELLSEKVRLQGLIRYASRKLDASGGGREKKWREARIAILTPMDKRVRELEIAVLRAELADAEKKNAKSLAADCQSALVEREEGLNNYQPPKFDFKELENLHRFVGGYGKPQGLIKRASDLQQTELVRELDQQLTFWENERMLWGERSRFGGFGKSDPEVSELAKHDARIEQIAEELNVKPEAQWIAPKKSHLYVRTDGGLRRAEELSPFDNKAKAAGLDFNGAEVGVWTYPYFVGDARLLLRGDVLYPDKLVPRATPVFFGESKLELEGSGRLQLAEWLTANDSTQAALVARAAVNRAWQHLFGEALCRTPKELGRLGEQPELPELIDGLAVSFVSNGWSMKKLVRQIVLSSAYRRSSVVAEADFPKDPDNRYFARQSVRRLEYEPILNTMAWLKSGRHFDTPTQRDAVVPGAISYAQFDSPSLYNVIDRRVASISATQALFLMNNANTARRIAGDLINRLEIHGFVALPDVLSTIYDNILQRSPTDTDRDFAQRFLERRRQQTGATQLRDEIHEFVTLLLCGNEILYIE